jgi:tyramine---L-glutamate ligase
MPTIFLYEECTAVGERGPLAGDWSESLFDEGYAMLAALAADFAQLPDWKLIVAWNGDREVPERLRSLGEVVPFGAKPSAELASLAKESDATILIAPECRDILLKRVLRVEKTNANLISPGSAFVKLTSDKQRLSEHFLQRDIPTPLGYLFPGGMKWSDVSEIISADNRHLLYGRELTLPLVIKPNDGVGSVGVQLFRSADDFPVSVDGVPYLPTMFSLWRVEQFVAGTPASIAFICGLDGCYPLMPCTQRFSSQLQDENRGGVFHYVGGALPLEPELTNRAIQLGTRAMQSLPQTRGYVGIDLVLGNASDGSEDYVIEVNPRLTTSYLGLRKAAQTSLALAMLDAVAGRKPNIIFGSNRVEFSCGIV